MFGYLYRGSTHCMYGAFQLLLTNLILLFNYPVDNIKADPVNSNYYLDAIQKKYSIKSDNGLAAALGVTRGSISGYRHGRSFLGIETCIKVARMLDLHPAVVLADCSAERAESDDERALWSDISRRFSPPSWSEMHKGQTA